ncbi:MAG: HTTM domain-containing protein [Bacteroidetes bacterium]|nr:HTTM domain-containing protein [Bacteroidota bacterium]
MLKQRYALDARALSLMRIGVGGILLLDLINRAASLTEYYTQKGSVPFSVELSYWKPGYFSFFQISDTYPFAVFIFSLSACIYFLLLVGYRTNITAFLAWLFLVSLQNRNTLILQAGDDLLRLLLFWGIFLPWASFYSLDSKKKKELPKKEIFSVATCGYMLLLFSLYFFTGILKSGAEWTENGNAIYYALSLDQMVLPLGKMLLPHTVLLPYLSFGVRWAEILIPVLLFIPLQNGLFRFLFILFAGLLQIAFALTLYVGLFYAIALIALIGLLPKELMNFLEKKIRCLKR